MSENIPIDTPVAPNWRHVVVFLGLTFGLTWLLNLAIELRGGLGAPGMGTVLQFQMLLPAFSAIVLGLFFFPESPIYRGRGWSRTSRTFRRRPSEVKGLARSVAPRPRSAWARSWSAV